MTNLLRGGQTFCDPEVEETSDDRIPLSDSVTDTKECIKARTVLGIMGFLGIANVYAMRVNLSVAIIAMTNNTLNPVVNATTLDICPSSDFVENVTSPVKNGPFNWDEEQQGLVLGSFFYGYVLTQIPGGRFAELFGGKLVFGLGVLFTAIFTLISPLAAYWNYYFFIVIRILEGLFEGVTFPSMHAMLARWIPPDERSKFAALVYAGSNFGTIVSLPLSGWLCTLDYHGGWPLCFYFFGSLGVLWFFAWIFLAYDIPESHPRISRQELEYITCKIGSKTEMSTGSVPWKNILCSLPLWAILVTQCGMAWQFYVQLTEMPLYMSRVLNMDFQKDATMMALPFLTSWLTGIVVSVFADWLIRRNYISQLSSYKVWNSVTVIIPSLGILGVAWVGCDQLSVLLLLSITGAFGGAVYAGYQMNHIALSPQYAGTMYGITNSAANLCGFLAPYVTGLITEGKETLSQWRVVFYLAGAINLVCNFFYLMFASAEEERWSIEASREVSDNENDDPQISDFLSNSM